jgi:hypothetical protein
MNMKTNTLTLIACALSFAACNEVKAPKGTDHKSYTEILNEGITMAQGYASFPQGEVTIMSGLASSMESGDAAQMRFPIQYLEHLQKAERDGFVTLVEKQQDALQQIGNMGARFFTVQGTQKLLSMADKDKSSDQWTQVHISRFKILEILSEAPCKLRRSTPGDEFRLIVGRLEDTPTDNAKTLGAGYCTTERQELKFRAILQYNPFNKEYSYVVADVGLSDQTGWQTNHVANIIDG